MSAISVHGQENVIAPGFYMPNRLSVQACKALNYLLQGRLCYITDKAFPPQPKVEEYLLSKKVFIDRFDFQHSTPLAAREHVHALMRSGRSVIFLPGQLSRVRGSVTEVPSLFLEYADAMNIPVVPLFSGYYGTTFDTLYRDMPESDSHEEFYVLPRLSAMTQGMGARLLMVWLEKGMEVLSDQPLLQESLTSHLVHSLHKYGREEMIDGMTGATVPYYKILGVAMTVSKHLRRRGEKRIGIILPPGPGGTICLLACMLAGITPVMINYATSRASFESTVRQAELKYFITAHRFMEKLPNFAWPPKERLILVENILKSLPKLALITNVMMARFMPARLLCKMHGTSARHGEDEAVMLFTAGSTGEPKGVALTHRMIMANIAQSCCRLSLDKERILGSLPLFHSFGLTIALLLPLIKGRPICTYPNPTEARTLCELIEKYKLTMLCATPAFARAMLRRAAAYTFATVRYFIVGAECLQADLEKEFMTRCGVQLLEGYGLTEAAPVCSVNLPDEPRVPGSAFFIPSIMPRTIGQLLPGIAIRVTDMDDDDKVIPITQRGMIWLKGPNIFRGYVNKPEFNDSVFRDGWFKTGDIGQVDLNGFVTLAGRLSRCSKIGGEMVPHEGVENAIIDIFKLSTGDELKISVTGVMDEQKGETLVLLSAIPEHADPNKEREVLGTVRAELAKRGLPNLWAPRYLVAVSAIPVLASGKQDLQRCRDLANEALFGSANGEPM